MDLKNFYQERISAHSSYQLKLNKKSKWYVIAKMITLFSSIYFLIQGFSHNNALMFELAVALIISFIAIYIADSKFLKKRQFVKNLLNINRSELNYQNEDISMFDEGKEYIDTEHEYTFDLDVFGKGSLFQAINRTVTVEGKSTLAKWLSRTNNSSSEIIERQEAVKELASEIDFQHNYRALAIGKELNFTALVESLGDEKLNRKISKGLLYWSVVSFTLITLLLTIMSILPYQLVVLLFFSQLFMVGSKFKTTNHRYSKLNGYYKKMVTYYDLLEYLKAHHHQFKSGRVKRLCHVLISKENSALEAFKELKKLLSRFDQRNNVLIAIITNGFMLSDLFLNLRYEKWIARFFDDIPDYKNALGEFDSLVSLANFKFNHPDFFMPVIANDTIINASELGHPLLSANSRVCNDYLVASHKSYHLVTGANMAGKSTFLRTIGVNLILACNGAPVCAKYYRFQPQTLFSSMRTSDNLVNHISYFQAELLRLKKLTITAKSHKNTFIILDEILKGTNSKDKLAGSRLFLKKLLDYNASGVLATHDLLLGELEKELPDHFKNICFEIEIDDEEIKYDYKLKEGVAQNLNATYLIEKMILRE